MIPKPSFDHITVSDIEALVADGIRESSTLEYKEALPVAKEKSDRNEFLYDVAAFANAGGGDLIYGVSEKRDAENKPTGIPDQIPGLGQINIDHQTRPLNSYLQSGVDPSIP